MNVIWILCVYSFNSQAENWQSFSLEWNKSPVDLRYLLDAPAGKHGYLGLKNNQFVFEDGKEFRAWGITLSGEACFPPHDQIPYLAERIARFGFNLVRFSNVHSTSIQPPLIESFFPMRLNKELMDRLDYFIFQLEIRGVYSCFGGLDSIELTEESGIELWDRVRPGLKSYIHFIPELQEIYADFLQLFWTHRNRYNNGKQYRDSPSIVFTQLFQDNRIDTSTLTIPDYNFELYALWTDWLQANGYSLTEEFDFEAPTKFNNQFMSELTAASYTRWHTYLRSMNVKALISADDHITTPRDLPPHWNMDFISASGIWNEPLGKSNMVPKKPMLAVDLNEKSNLFSELSFSRLKSKAFLITGWSEPFPNMYSAELPLWISAIAGLQDWQGVIMDSVQMDRNYRTETLSTSNHWIDPTVMGLLPAASILFYENEIQATKTKATMQFEDDTLFGEEQINLFDVQPTRLVEKAQIQVDIEGKSSGANVYSPTMPESIDKIQLENSLQVNRDSVRGLLLINTPKVKAFVGNIKKSRRDDISGFRVRSQESFAVISAAALDQQPIFSSKNILMTVASQAKNTGMLSHEQDFGISLLRLGTPPILIKDIPCRISIQTKAKQALLSTINEDGSFGTTVPFQIQNDWLSFMAGTDKTIYYRLSFQHSN